jgi:DNA repair exonuclease SbcCD nuclease subunit
MKLALLSDTHVHAWQEFAEDVNGISSRLRHCVEVFSDVRSYCEEHGIRLVVHSGDLFHKRGILYTQAYNLVVRELALMQKAGITVLANVGNHDQADRAGAVHCLDALASAGLLTTVGEKGWHNQLIFTGELRELIVSMIAYCDSAEEFKRRADECAADSSMPKNQHRILVCHHGFSGARVGSALEYQVREEIQTKVLADFPADAIYSGHYHARQVVGKKTKVTYIGSPMEFVRGDGTGEPKGFLVYDTETNTHEVVPLKRPRFVTLTQEDLADDEFTTKELVELVEHNFVDVSYDELPVRWSEMETWLMKHNAEGVKPCPRARVSEDKVRLRVDPQADQKTLLEKYLDFADAPREDRADLLRVGTDLLQRSEE